MKKEDAPFFVRRRRTSPVNDAAEFLVTFETSQIRLSTHPLLLLRRRRGAFRERRRRRPRAAACLATGDTSSEIQRLSNQNRPQAERHIIHTKSSSIVNRQRRKKTSGGSNNTSSRKRARKKSFLLHNLFD